MLVAFTIYYGSRFARPRLRDGHIVVNSTRVLRRLRATALVGAVAYGATGTYLVPVIFTPAAAVMAFPLGCAAALIALRMSIWGTYLGIRAGAAARRRLPWRLDSFLADCGKIGVLRDSGQTYRFRHEEVRAQLAKSP